ncbi:ABC transporter C family member 13-like [Vigna unguiculata]|uniref:ABC transporter C family member 13-like n=1 Tax=Vigna unguiculata TaxID=3917 RepID=UPI001015D7A7|nr:ABC transporter C family member 13-like [Vigna unguiculata]XP_027926557.1 ABC transporter C family member 13-like [Vigna unguiculata]XP_027926558.1 ABC transporter C family member 13-like [Vigna unguiculata]
MSQRIHQVSPDKGHTLPILKKILDLDTKIQDMKKHHIALSDEVRAAFPVESFPGTAVLKSVQTRKYLDAWCVFFWATTPTLFSLSTFGLYALMGHQLDAAMVFSCLALFNTLISPLNSFPWVINGLIDAIISSGRLSRFLACPEHKFKRQQPDSDQGLGVFIKDACCTLSSSEEQALNMVLNHVTLSVSQGSFVAVIGEVGSGKSSLLYSILGEMQLVRGSVYSNESTAYVPQVPWILSGRVHDNILFGKIYDPERSRGFYLERCVTTYYLGKVMILKGSVNVDGYLLALSLGLTSIINSLMMQIEYPETVDLAKLRHRFMSSYEQKVQPFDKRYQYLLL